MTPNLPLVDTTTSSISRINLWLEPHPKLEGVAMIDHLFNRLDGMYPQRWRGSFQNQQAIKNWRQAWAEGLAEEEITLEEIKRGLQACRTRFCWPPSLPEFLSACRPPFDFEAAFLEAVEQMERRLQSKDSWSHPAIYWAAVDIGHFNLRNGSWKTIQVRWTHALQAALDKGQWPEIPPNREALPDPGKAKSSYEVQRQHIDGLIAMLAKKMSVTQGCVNAVDGEV